MAMFPAHSFWPARDRTPVFRLAMALMVAPSVIASVISVLAFLIAGMTETTAAEVARVTVQSATALSALVFVFTLTFGLAGIAVLWRLARRGAAAWALTGGAAGAIAGALFSALALSGVHQALVIGFAVAGWALFLLIRRLAGIRHGPAGG